MLVPARPSPHRKPTPRGDLPRALRDVLDCLLHARLRGTICTRLALEHVTTTRNRVAVYQYIHRLRQDHAYTIRTLPCPGGDPSAGGYDLQTWPESIEDANRVGFSIGA